MIISQSSTYIIQCKTTLTFLITTKLMGQQTTFQVGRIFVAPSYTTLTVIKGKQLFIFTPINTEQYFKRLRPSRLWKSPFLLSFRFLGNKTWKCLGDKDDFNIDLKGWCGKPREFVYILVKTLMLGEWLYILIVGFIKGDLNGGWGGAKCY